MDKYKSQILKYGLLNFIIEGVSGEKAVSVKDYIEGMSKIYDISISFDEMLEVIIDLFELDRFSDKSEIDCEVVDIKGEDTYSFFGSDSESSLRKRGIDPYKLIIYSNRKINNLSKLMDELIRNERDRKFFNLKHYYKPIITDDTEDDSYEGYSGYNDIEDDDEDVMKVKKDIWGNRYTVGGIMWDKYNDNSNEFGIKRNANDEW